MPVTSREAIRNAKHYRSARSIESVKRERGLSTVIKLAGNENNLGCSPAAKQALNDCRSVDLARYPDHNCTRLKAKLTVDLGINADQLIFGNGSFELLSLIAQTFLEYGDESVIPQPTFGWYRLATLNMGANVVPVPLQDHVIDLEGVLRSVTGRTRIVWICNPNNPTGTVVEGSVLVSFLERLSSNILVVLDEAYCDYLDVPGYPDTVELIRRFPNIISLRTFSKVHGLASLRLGYGISSPEIIAEIGKVKMPSNVNFAVQEAALASLNDLEFRKKVLANNSLGKRMYAERLSALGLGFIPTHGNFIMLDTGADSESVVEEFLNQGIIIRGGHEFGMPSWLRITIGTEEENRLVLDLLEKIVRPV
ncbi:Histidinol-phosphate aminotransferase 2 [compost metagenome]